MDGLELRDIHEPLAPSWWPPAPGWWIVLAVLAIVAGVLLWLRWRRWRRRQRLARLFDDAVARADGPAQRIAAMSELLRRAARRRHPGADMLEGDAWLRVLDEGLPTPVFSSGPGALLRDGAFRRDADVAAVEALRRVARARFLQLAGADA